MSDVKADCKTPCAAATAEPEKKEKKKKKTSAEKAKDAVFANSEGMAKDVPTVKGYDFNEGINFDKLLESYKQIGFQATYLGRAIDEINRMLKWRLSDEPLKEEDEPVEGEEKVDRSKVKCTIFLGYTSNMISCGLREIIRYLAEHNLINAIVTTTGGVEEDLIKCLAPSYVGEFRLQGSMLRKKGLNRIGNLLVPNKNYCQFEDWINPILDAMLKEQNEQHVLWTPSRVIARLGKEINNPESVYYWAWKNNIPVLCPALTDGSIGDMMYFHSFNHPGLVVDIVEDLRIINNMAVHAAKTGMIILGGGVIKHHICNANLMRNGADFSVYINTGQEFDGSDAGAHPDEAVSWGKIKASAEPVKVFADATLVFPLIVAQTFAKLVEEQKAQKKVIATPTATPAAAASSSSSSSSSSACASCTSCSCASKPATSASH